jgi:hypothetical protein
MKAGKFAMSKDARCDAFCSAPWTFAEKPPKQRDTTYSFQFFNSK